MMTEFLSCYCLVLRIWSLHTCIFVFVFSSRACRIKWPPEGEKWVCVDFLHEGWEMTMNGCWSFNTLAVIFILLSTAGKTRSNRCCIFILFLCRFAVNIRTQSQSGTCPQKLWLGRVAEWVTILRIWLGRNSYSTLTFSQFLMTVFGLITQHESFKIENWTICSFCPAKCAVIC